MVNRTVDSYSFKVMLQYFLWIFVMKPAGKVVSHSLFSLSDLLIKSLNQFFSNISECEESLSCQCVIYRFIVQYSIVNMYRHFINPCYRVVAHEQGLGQVR